MSAIQFQDLSDIREKHKNQSIVFCSGCFDLTHAGHVLFFEDCKRQGDVLVVMLGNDTDISLYKSPDRPIVNEQSRLKVVSSLSMVDYAFIDPFSTNGDVLVSHSKVFEQLKPDMYVVNEDAFDIPRREKIVEGTGTALVVLPRTCPPEFENISTTSIIKKIRAGN